MYANHQLAGSPWTNHQARPRMSKTAQKSNGSPAIGRSMKGGRDGPVSEAGGQVKAAVEVRGAAGGKALPAVGAGHKKARRAGDKVLTDIGVLMAAVAG